MDMQASRDLAVTQQQAWDALNDPEVLKDALRSLADLVGDGRLRELVIGKVDGEPVATSRFGDALLAAGFVTGYRGYALRSMAPAFGRPCA